MKKIMLYVSVFLVTQYSFAQCIDASSGYSEDFESGDGGWISGTYSGSSNTWAVGTPNKTVINSACGGSSSYVLGGTTGAYDAGEHSYAESPCFDFSTMINPSLSMCIWWEMENGYDGLVLQYSIDGGGSWADVGSSTSGACEGASNWYNNTSINYLYGGQTGEGWSGHQGGPYNGGCGTAANASGGWVTATHCLPGAGLANVKFRFLFGGGTQCEADGFAFDNIQITDGSALSGSGNAQFSVASCSKQGSKLRVEFTNESTASGCFDDYLWDFGDGDTDNSSGNVGHSYDAGAYTTCLTVSSGGCSASIYCCDMDVSGGSGSACNLTTSNCGNILPVTLMHFNAEAVKGDVSLNWATASELNNSHFIVLRSNDGKAFKSVGKVNGAGNSTIQKKYRFTDHSPGSGIIYYRLKQIDYSGASKISNMVSVKNYFEDQLKAYVAGDELVLNLSNAREEAEVKIEVYNVTGQKVFQKIIQKGAGSVVSEQITNWSNGIYFLKVYSGNTVFNQKIFKN